MIVERKALTYTNRVLIEKVTIKPPFRYEAIFQNEGCFLHVTGKETIIHDSQGSLELKTLDTVLLRCGTYFVDWLSQADSNTIEVIAFHLYPDVLQTVYRTEIPRTIQDHAEGTGVRRIEGSSVISAFIETLSFYFDNPSLVNDDLLELKIKELMLLLVQTQQTDSFSQLMSGIFSPRKTKLQNVVQAHLYSPLSVDDLAKLCDMSTSSFKREFQKQYDTSPIAYLNKQRLVKAAELLRVSDLSVAEIAFRVGYQDPSYFARQFREEYEMTPTEFRSSKP